MSRSVSAGFSTEIAAVTTAPGYLLEIGFTVPLRLCTRGNITFKGVSFIEWGFGIEGLTPSVDAQNVDSSILLFDPDRTIQAFILNEGIEEKRIQIWKYYGDVADSAAIDLHNPIEFFNGYGSECQIDPGKAAVTITLLTSMQRVMMTPRIRMSRDTGFNHLPVNGVEYEFGGDKWKAESEG